MFKKYLIVIVLASMLIGMVPARTQATGLPVIDFSNLGEAIWQGIRELARWAAEDGWKALRDAAVKQIVDELTNDIIAGIEGGGDAKFVGDWSGYLKDGGDAAFSQVNNYLTVNGANLCAPFAPQLRLSFGAKFAAQSQTFKGMPITCRFEDFKANLQNTKSFIESGGWAAFDDMFYPENNFLGMSILLTDAYSQEAEERLQAKQQEAQSSQGFLSVKTCVEWRTLKEGSVPIKNESEAMDFAKKEYAKLTDIEKMVWKDEKDYVETWLDGNCSGYKTATPGNVVAEAASKAVFGKDFAYAENVESILSALVNTLIGKAFNAAEGFLDKSAKSFGSDVEGLSYAGEYASSTQKTIMQEIDGTRNQYSEVGGHIDNLLSLISRGEYAARTAIRRCMTMTKLGPPKWGTLIYGNSDNVEGRSYAALGDLIDYPHVGPSGESIPKSSDPNYYPNGKEGWFTQQKEKLLQAKIDAQANLDYINKIVPGDLVNPENASSILNNISGSYGTFLKNYRTQLGEVLNREELSGGGPGTTSYSAGYSSMLNSVVDGVSWYDVSPDNELLLPNLPGIGGPRDGGRNFFYCY